MDTEMRGLTSLALNKEHRFSRLLGLGPRLSTLHSYIRRVLFMRHTWSNLTVIASPVPRTVISLQVGSPRMRAGGMAENVGYLVGCDQSSPSIVVVHGG